MEVIQFFFILSLDNVKQIRTQMRNLKELIPNPDGVVLELTKGRVTETIVLYTNDDLKEYEDYINELVEQKSIHTIKIVKE